MAVGLIVGLPGNPWIGVIVPVVIGDLLVTRGRPVSHGRGEAKARPGAKQRRYTALRGSVTIPEDGERLASPASGSRSSPS